MKHTDFKIGIEFDCSDRRWKCTDIGRRVIVAIRLDEVRACTKHGGGSITERILVQADAKADGWFRGPPYAVAEVVFDEDDLEGCKPAFPNKAPDAA